MKQLLSVILVITLMSVTVKAQKNKPPTKTDSTKVQQSAMASADSLPKLTDSTAFVDLRAYNEFVSVLKDLYVNPKFYAEKKPMDQYEIIKTNLDIIVDKKYKEWLDKNKKSSSKQDSKP